MEVLAYFFPLSFFGCFDVSTLETEGSCLRVGPGFEFKTVTTNVECTCIKIRVPAYSLPHGVVMQIIVQQPIGQNFCDVMLESKRYLEHKTNHKYLDI
jgi:hypothetical protein